MSSLQIEAGQLAVILERKAAEFVCRMGAEEVGEIIETGDSIAHVSGLPGAMSEEMLQFPGGVYGMALDLGREYVGAIIFGDPGAVVQGGEVRRTCRVMRVPVGEALLGRVVNPLGEPLDGRGPIRTTEFREVECAAPGIVERESVSRPLQTGLKSIDAMTAIGRGQRELIIGDRQTGKTTVAVDTILNQRAGDVRCVYVAIGQKMSTVAALVRLLEERKVLDNCIVLAAPASDSAPFQFIAPFAGCAMAEFFRDRGDDALIVYDDLSKHAIAYREISLVLHRPAGREAYPGDIFYLHSRLLERASRLHAARGGGSLTALPIVETQQGDFSAFIPTNLISITDGQIYLERELFHQGFRPAINVGLSVSRVGGKAQLPAMKKVALKLRIELAQYREVAAFARLSSDLDAATAAQIRRGERLTEVLKQPPHSPMPMALQVFALWAAVQGHIDDIPVTDVMRFQTEWMEFLERGHGELGRQLMEAEDLTPAISAALEGCMRQFRAMFVVTGRMDEDGRDVEDGALGEQEMPAEAATGKA